VRRFLQDDTKMTMGLISEACDVDLGFGKEAVTDE